MLQYIALIHDSAVSAPSSAEWKSFFELAGRSGIFRGGSEIGEREFIGGHRDATPTDHIVGYMRFDAEDKQKVLDLLERHPVVRHGGTVELCLMPES